MRLIAPAELKPELDKYELCEEIGHGGMATVYRARDRRLERDVAVKVIHRHLRENKEVAARFTSEARAVAKVKHPNIVEVYDVSEENDAERYLVVELVRGTTLRKLLQENGHMPPEVAAALSIEIASGLHHAHQQGVVHRDVKPENVLVEPPRNIAGKRDSHEVSSEARSARVKITDFGIAKLLDVQGVTSTGQVLGSPAHMAPEQIEGADVSARADVFGLGVLFYECVVGRLPFDGKNPAQVLRRVLDGKYPPAERARPTVGSRYSCIADKALAHDAADRYESAEAFAQDLKDELMRLGFDDPKRELAEYLVDPAAYARGYEERVVARLAEQGRRARKDRNVQLAASDFNRALAFRPDDVDLIAQVAGLARAQRLRRTSLRLLAIAGVSLALGGVAYGVAKKFKDPVDEVSAPAIKRRALIAETQNNIALQGRDPRPSGSVSPEARMNKRPAAKRPGRPQRGGEIAVPQPRKVMLVQGRDGIPPGLVKIDGEEKRDWLKTTYTVPVGKHRFEFFPPDDKCCEGPRVVEVEIVASRNPDEVQHVTAYVVPKLATLVFRGPEGSALSCPDLGEFKPHVPRDFRHILKLTSCTVLPPKDSGEAPRDVPVELRAGRVFTVTWP